MASTKDLKANTALKRQYLAWLKKQSKGGKLTFSQWVKAKKPGYKEPKAPQKKKSMSVREHQKATARVYKEATGRTYGSTPKRK